ncbi:MAG: ATP-binding cassette domain-containing protein [Acidimicrobiales bacterium]
MIAVQSLSKRYGRATVVDNLTFDVTPGVVTGFLGPNGSGKSTTMRMIMGLSKPATGSALVNGSKYHELKWPLREVGALLDAKGFNPGRTAHSHLSYLAKTNGIAAKRVDEVIDLVGLTSVAGRRGGKFSLGMGQRLGIAGALLGDPGTLLFDEPVNGLDPEGIRWIRFLLRDLAAEGRTIFVSSHLISEMALTAERLVVIGRGSLIAETSVQEFTSRNASQAVRVVSPAPGLFELALTGLGAEVSVEPDGALTVKGMSSAEIGDLANTRSLTIHELTPVRGSLEDAFMDLTNESVEFRSSNHLVTTGASRIATRNTKEQS